MTIAKFLTFCALFFVGTPVVIRRMPELNPRVVLPRPGIDDPDAYDYREDESVLDAEEQRHASVVSSRHMEAARAAMPASVKVEVEKKAEKVEVAAPVSVLDVSPARSQDKYEALAKEYVNRK